MAFSPELRDHVLELLEPLGPVTARPMFGGAGFFLDGTMFVLLTRSDVLYLRTGDETRSAFEAAGMGPFRPRSGKSFVMPYHEAPPEAMEDPDAMQEWAELAWQAARRGRRRKESHAQGGKKSHATKEKSS